MSSPTRVQHVPPAMDAEWFVDGSMLERAADEHVRGFRGDGLGGGPLAGCEYEVTWGSICSGTDAVLFVLAAVAAAYAKIGVTMRFVHCFSCEASASVQKWIQGLHSLECGMSGCLFEDATCMGDRCATCKIHGQKCRVPCVDLSISGTSCKDFSKANKNRKGMNVLVSEGTPGGSAQTAHGTFSIVMMR